jgi:5-methylcytosine-specific restriction endonuclease McrA
MPPENTMMICNQCNSIKGDRPLSYLLKVLNLL